MKNKKRTVDYMKEKRKVSEEVKDNLKSFNRIKKMILKALESNPKTIPQISEETKLALDVVTYHLMTLRKYGKIEVGEIDDMDEFYTYKIKGK